MFHFEQRCAADDKNSIGEMKMLTTILPPEPKNYVQGDMVVVVVVASTQVGRNNREPTTLDH
jgi:hypothetical protein